MWPGSSRDTRTFPSLVFKLYIEQILSKPPHATKLPDGAYAHVMTHDERNGMACTYKEKFTQSGVQDKCFLLFSSLANENEFDVKSTPDERVGSPYLLYVNPIQSIYHLEMPTLSSSNHCPNAWHKFWLSDRVVCVWCASECDRLVPNYSLPARGWCRMLLSVHPEICHNVSYIRYASAESRASGPHLNVFVAAHCVPLIDTYTNSIF